MRILFLQDTIDSESIGVAYVSAVLKEAGHNTELFILSLERDIDSRIREFSPDIIAFSIVVTKQRFYERLGGYIKSRFPDIKIVAGGPFITLKPEFVNQGFIDFGIVGEGEEAVVELVNSIESKSSIDGIKNLVFKRDNELIVNELRPLVEDIDRLPLPDRGLYLKYNSFRNLTVKRFISGRGCPYSCNFCFTRRFRDMYHNKGKYVRKHSVERVCEEIERLRSVSVVNTVHFSDDIFFTNKEWITKFYDIYPKRIGIPFQCNLTASIIDEDVVRLLKEAGLRGVGIGLESGNEEIRKSVLNKRFSNDEIKRVAGLLHKYGIEIYTYNMIALPKESIDDALMTLELNREMRVGITQCNIAIPFEGLPFTDTAIDDGLLDSEGIASEMDKRPETPIIKVEHPEQFERLFLLFPFLVKTRLKIRTIKWLLRMRLNFIYRILHRITYIWNMKRYYDISLISGFKIFLDIKKGERYLKEFFKRCR